MIVTSATANDNFKAYFKADKTFSQYTVDFVDGINELDPLVMLNLINGENSLQNRMDVVTQMIVGKTVVLYEGEKKVKSFIHNGTGTISLLFKDEPYLLQVLVDYGYALILKKLTPPSSVSNEEVSG